MGSFFKTIGVKIKNFFLRIKVFFLFHFRLKPKIAQMSIYVAKIASLKKDVFPEGKSVFVFEGASDTLYFVVYKELDAISVTEVYDDVLNKLPQQYALLNRVSLSQVVVRP
ncbi:MAG: hypothetical protein A2Y33_10840 [Spirochaetes bacterium GWF1_51_8]|nr:MAG: hypothetical protein A2Y33_10840 [Spirochaetes bacterium GWF1_51_8]